jgi:hypothetical protein
MSQAKPSKIETSVDQASLMQAKPQLEHQWLHKLVGEWTYETEVVSSGGQPEKLTGTERVRSLGGIWVQAEAEGAMPDGRPATTVMTLGYDPDKRRFVGTWIGSMMTHLWIYDGELDADERVLTLHSEGPSMTGDGTMAHYRDVIEFKSEDHRLLTAFVLNEDEKWQQFMTMTYRRTRRG